MSSLSMLEMIPKQAVESTKSSSQESGSANELDAQINRRLGSWFPGQTTNWDARQMVLASIRIERCQSEENDRRCELINIANDPGPAWDCQRDLEASELGAKLSRRPELIQMHLKATREGRAWLTRQWRGLIDVLPLAPSGIWTKAQVTLAINLLGIARELRASMQLMNTMRDSTNAKALAESEIAALAQFNVDSAMYDSSRRDGAKCGFGMDEDAVIRRLRRDEAKAFREMHAAQKALKLVATSKEVAAEPEPKKAQVKVAAVPTPEVVAEPVTSRVTTPVVRADVAHEVPVGNRHHRRAIAKIRLHEEKRAARA